MKACFASQMREVDRAASEKGGIPSIVLMENAAIACVNELKNDFKELKEKRIAVFCGKGNNGGDGFAIARHLSNIGAEVSVYLVCGNEFKGDAKINFDIIKRMNVNTDVISDTENIGYIIRSNDIVIDAIYGTGIHGTIDGISYDVIQEINENSGYTMSVDVPSGINSDSGEICGICVKADKTVTFAAYKVGMLMFPAADYVGNVVVADISIPDYIIEGQGIDINVTDGKFIRDNFPRRMNNSHKGDYGKALVIAGSVGMTGAAYLSSQSAVISGSGLVTLAIPSSLNGAMEAKTTEVMTLPVDDIYGHISSDASETILKRTDKVDAVLIGPGLGQSSDALKIIKNVLNASRVPVIVDADGINAVAKNIGILSDCTCPVIFTPHTAEMSRLTGLSMDYIEENRLMVSKEFAEEYGVTLILKGHHTIVTGQDGEQYINITGNPGLATGGSGDVLAGITASMVSRGINETKAAAMAVYIHGVAGDIAAAKYGMESVTASKVMENIPDALRQILQVEKQK
ncbi:MAG: NAD(P)H-hydrate dehydratase [Oscillospiraceae bacterium]|nr:NAD(P)H-hydrate dehydratase [Oscillospiraceae bacterium]